MPFDFHHARTAAATLTSRHQTGSGVGYDHVWRAVQKGWTLLASAVGACRTVLSAVAGAWQSRRERSRMRQQLMAMDDCTLRDIGISRCDAVQEAQRILWRP